MIIYSFYNLTILTHLLNTLHYTIQHYTLRYATLHTIIHERLFDNHFASLVNPYQYTIIYTYIHAYTVHPKHHLMHHNWHTLTPYTARVCTTFNSQNKMCFYHLKNKKIALKIRGSNSRNKMLKYKRMFINKKLRGRNIGNKWSN